MHKEFLNPSDLPSWTESFSQVVVVRTGLTRTIYISGQVSVDESKSIVGQGDLAAQADYAVGNLAKALAAAGSCASDVVRLGIYVKNYRRDQAGIINAALGRLFDRARMPVSTWLGVAALALDELLIEIEATAVVDDKAIR